MRRSRARGTNAAAAATATDMDLEPEDSDRVVTPPSPPAVEFARSASERKFEVSGHTFQVPRSYSFIKAVGAGAYGVVCACRDTTTQHKVAIKKVSGAFENEIESLRVLREIKLLRTLNHENIVGLVDVLVSADSPGELKDVYEVTELMDTELGQIINSRQDLTNEHVQYFMYQLLCALKYLHSANVWHRDIKPGNLLVNQNCDLKLCDFGLARFAGAAEEDGLDMTEYVVTRWYRAPELILSREYEAAVDVWSAGCIMAELLGRKPIFRGRDYIHQLEAIFQVMGTPSEAQMGHIRSQRARSHVLGLPRHEKATPLCARYAHASDEAISLLQDMLQFEPRLRLSADQALGHPFFDSLRDGGEPVCEESLRREFMFEYDSRKSQPQKGEAKTPGGKTFWQGMVWDEIRVHHPELPPASAF